jgi:hypothetical protein
VPGSIAFVRPPPPACPSGKYFRQLAAALIRQVQHHNDRHQAFGAAREYRQQRLDPASRSADHDGFIEGKPMASFMIYGRSVPV